MSRVLCGVFLLFLILTGCSEGDKKEQTAKTEPAQQEAAEPIAGQSVKEKVVTKEPVKEKTPKLQLSEFTEEAWLRGSLPEKTEVYLRIPTPWFLFTGIENGFKYAQKNEKHVQLLQAIQEGLHEQLLSQLDPTLKPLSSILYDHMKSPLEIGVIPNDANPMAPTVILATKLDYATADAFNKDLTSLLALDEMIQETEPINAEGVGAFAVPALMTNCVYSFNVQTKEMLLVTSNDPSKEQLKTLLTGIAPTPHSMHAIEGTIDASNKGLFGYINVKNLLPSLQPFLKPEEQMGFKMTGLDQMRALAFGYGASQDKTRLKIVIDIPNVGFRSYLPVVNNSFDFNARGDIDFLAVAALPTETQFKQLENLTLLASGEPPQEYTQFKTIFKEQTGFEIDQIFSIIGPEVAFFSDDINDFFALKLNNPEQFKQFIDTASQKGWLTYNEYQKDDLTIKHVAIPFTTKKDLQELTSLIQNNESAGNLPALLNMVGNIRSHSYWVEEDGFLIGANIPQPLIERNLRNDKTSIKEWLATSQKHDLSNSLFALTASKKDISRNFYYHYLQFLHFLADISKTEIDFLSLPHAGELNFPEKGSVGFSLNSNDNHIALEFSFEESMLDLLYATGGTYETVAIVGIMSAVAIPQFEAYREKAEINEAFVAVAYPKQVVEDQLRQGIPRNEIKNGTGILLSPTDYANKNIRSIEVNNGAITVTLAKDRSGLATGSSITFTPLFDQSTDTIDWECTSKGIKANRLLQLCEFRS